MTSRHFALLGLLLIFVTTEANAQNRWNNNRTVTASDNRETETRNIDGFSEIKVCCSIEVELTRSNNFSVEVEAADNILPLVLTEVEGDRLIIKLEPNLNITNTNKIRVKVSMPDLVAVSVSSSSKVFSNSTFTGDQLDLKCSSSANISLNYEGRNIAAKASSSGRIEISGEAQDIDASASSSGRILAADLQVKNADAKASSSGRIELYALERLRGDARTSGNILYRGNPDQLDSDTASSGKVKSLQ